MDQLSQKAIAILRSLFESKKTELDSPLIREFANLLGELKSKFKDSERNDLANDIWGVQQCLQVRHHYLTSFMKLKEESYYEAWCSLEECEIALADLAANFPEVAGSGPMLFIDEATRRFQSLFPYAIFGSAEMVFKRVECSICGRARSITSECGHEVGKLYAGEMCANRVVESELVGVSLTQSPSHKYAVVFESDSGGNPVDQFDYSVVKAVVRQLESPFDSWDLRLAD